MSVAVPPVLAAYVTPSVYALNVSCRRRSLRACSSLRSLSDDLGLVGAETGVSSVLSEMMSTDEAGKAYDDDEDDGANLPTSDCTISLSSLLSIEHTHPLLTH